MKDTSGTWNCDWWDDKLIDLDSKTLLNEVIARKKGREFTSVTEEDLEDGRYEHITFLGKG